MGWLTISGVLVRGHPVLLFQAYDSMVHLAWNAWRKKPVHARPFGKQKERGNTRISMSPSMAHLQWTHSLQLSTPLKESTTCPPMVPLVESQSFNTWLLGGWLQDLNYNRYQNQLKPRNQEQLKFASHKYNKRYIDFFFLREKSLSFQLKASKQGGEGDESVIKVLDLQKAWAPDFGAPTPTWKPRQGEVQL